MASLGCNTSKTGSALLGELKTSSEWDETPLRKRLMLMRSSELRSALKELASILRRIYKDKKSRRDASEAMSVPILSDLLLLREYWFDKTPEVTEPAHVDDVKKVEFSWRAASAVYGGTITKLFRLTESKDDLEAIAERCPGLEIQYRSTPSLKVARPEFFIGTHEKTLLVAIRGTLDVGDVLTDLVGKARDFLFDDDTGEPLVAAHEFIANAADNIVNEIAPLLLDLLNDVEELLFTGHSLGAGTALLAALHVQHKMNTRTTTKKKKVSIVTDEDRFVAALATKNIVVRAVTFAPPPVVSFDSDSVGDLMTNLESYFVEDDVVPSLSFRSMLTFAAQLDAIDDPFPPLKRYAYLLTRPIQNVLPLLGSRKRRSPESSYLVKTLDPVLSDVVATSNKEAETDVEAPLMTVPGKLIKLTSAGPRRETSFPEIKVKDHSLEAHLPIALENAVSTLKDLKPKIAVARAVPSSDKPSDDAVVATPADDISI